MNKINIESELLKFAQFKKEQQFSQGIQHLNSAIKLAEELSCHNTATIINTLLKVANEENDKLKYE